MMTNFEKVNTLVFDWGNTLMKVDPRFTGAMAGWPEVSAIDGAAAALQQLHTRYNLVLASNAADSDAEDIRRALARVGLDDYFSHILPSRQLGYAKPDSAFFHSLLSHLNLKPEEVLHIGDDYQNDVLAACHAGWNAVWYNPSHKPAAGLMPLQTGEIQHMADLPALLQSPPLPGYDTCLSWLLQNGASFMLLAHVQSVAAIAYQTALYLQASGEKVDALLAQRGGLLHDIAKLAPGTPEKQDHGIRGAHILEQLGQNELAQITLRHPLFCLEQEERRPLTWEQKVVYLADKLVEGAALASLEQRLQALQNRYPQNAERIQACSSSLYSLYNEICCRIGVPAAEYDKKLQDSLFNT